MVLMTGFTKAGNGDNNNSSNSNNTKVLTGKVTDKETGEVLAGVKIQIKGTDTFCYTNLEGSFVLTVSVNDKPEVSLDVVGYDPMTLPASEIGFNTSISLLPRQ